VGDLPGITGRLDYLRWLGVDALWISPIFPSPMADFGYDVADYMDIHPLFGTLADFDRLVAEAHRRGLRVILDYVPNHTSDRHPWFVTSRASRDSPKRDWYLWRDPAPDGGPPNNWLSVFGGPAWTLDEATGQYYYHAYLKEQPDLNWRNPAVRRAMLDVLRFWLDRGVDGFRVDALRQLIKDDRFRDNPPNPDYGPGQSPYHALLPLYTTDRPEVQDMIALMRRVTDAYPERLLIGELYLPIARLVAYYGVGGRGVHLPFNFHLILTPWDARWIAALIDEYEAALPPGGWPNWVLGNHDRPRVASRVGAAQARVAAMLLLTLRGTPTLYNGDEIGMHDVPIPPDLVQDPFEKNVPGKGLGRDPERTPMQWDAGPGAGFTTGAPWLPLADDYQAVNVAAERDDPRSILTLYRRLIALRRAEPALAVGAYAPVEAEGDALAYIRGAGGRRFLVALNLGGRPQRVAPPSPSIAGRVALSTGLDREGEAVWGAIDLRGDEGLVIALD
ncbi:MAG: alpha-amylase family glycosyl hydrolase, partial [Chloroflexota bacterium]|nr:alpha-amylase family glycosyl hydrolase [Chloroflexota bacterium]